MMLYCHRRRDMQEPIPPLGARTSFLPLQARLPLDPLSLRLSPRRAIVRNGDNAAGSASPKARRTFSKVLRNLTSAPTHRPSAVPVSTAPTEATSAVLQNELMRAMLSRKSGLRSMQRIQTGTVVLF